MDGLFRRWANPVHHSLCGTTRLRQEQMAKRDQGKIRREVFNGYSGSLAIQPFLILFSL